MRILLVEDDPRIGDAIRDHVADAGHSVDWATTLREARALVTTVDYALVLLDLALPDGNGLSFLRQRSGSLASAGVIVLTAQDRLSDRIDGLDAGADDYLVKPFDLDELVARIRAVDRRRAARHSNTVRIGALTIDLAAHELQRDGQRITLTAREWALLERLARRPGALVTRGDLETALYDLSREVSPNAIEAQVSRLRKKLGSDAVHTERGLGYRLVGTGEPSA